MFSDAWFYIMASEMNGLQAPFSWDPLIYSLVKALLSKTWYTAMAYFSPFSDVHVPILPGL